MALIRRPRNRYALTPRTMIDRFFEEPFPIRSWWDEPAATSEHVPLDIFEEEDTIVVRAAMPGMKPEDVHVEVHDDELHIWGETREERERREDTYFLRENRFGRVDRRAMLPHAVKADAARAEYGDGILTLRLPRAQEVQGREIKVEAKK